jgi:ribonucleases P/MRP protein subunit RPP40
VSIINKTKYKARPHLEFSSPAWSIREVKWLEAVQKKAVGMVSGLEARTYEDRCKELKIQTLVERRQDQDMTQVFRLTKGIGYVHCLR